MATKIKKVLVTGGSGFIGKHLIKALGERGANYDLKTTDQQIMDVLDYDLFESIVETLKPRAIVHLAAISSLEDSVKNPFHTLQTNILGTYNVLEAAKKHKVRVILASSASVYEPSTSLYAASKKSMETIAELFNDVVIMRFYNVYGPGSKSVVNKFVNAAKKRKKIVLNGNPTRDYIYIDDVVTAILSMVYAENPPPLIDIGTGREVTLRKLMSLVEKYTGRSAVKKYGPPIKEIAHSVAPQECSYYKVTLEQGIRRLL